MNPKIVIRSESAADLSAITGVTVAAFKTLEISNHTEQFIIEALRAAGVLTISLVAELHGRVIGHIAFSPVTISDGTPDWYGLGPVSVLPEYQRQGIGKALIREGLARLRGMHARGCCLVGHPAYYGKFGFDNPPELVHEGVPPEAFFAMSFDGNIPQGTVTFHEAFKADGQLLPGEMNQMPKIMPHLWFDKEAKEAAQFYTAVFDDSEITSTTTIHDTPSGDAETVGFRIMGYGFMAISAGPFFKINPSISFHVRCRTVEEVDRIWEKLAPGGTVMMELGEYPFSKRYGWIQDRYGVSWQVIHTEGDFEQRIVPALMFVGDVCGKAEEAIGFYASVFRDAKAQVLARYVDGEEPDRAGTVKYAQFILHGQEFGAMDSAWMHDFGFNEAISFIVNCKDQQEIDYFWDKLSAVPEAEQCGWVKDKYGVSWQIVPANMGELIARNPAKTTPVMLKMKKIIIADLEKAAEED